VTMLLGGLWHGAAVNFVLWGLWHGLGLALHRWWRENRRWRLPTGCAWGLTMGFVLYGWLLFRADSPARLLALHEGLSHWTLPVWWTTYIWNLTILAAPLLAVEGWQHRTGSVEFPGAEMPRAGRAVVLGFLVLGIALCWETEASPFIYFQF